MFGTPLGSQTELWCCAIGLILNPVAQENRPDGTRIGKVIVTKDGGKSCEDIAHLPGELPWSVFFLNERDGWVGGIGTVLRTEDGGNTWRNTRTGEQVSQAG